MSSTIKDFSTIVGMAAAFGLVIAAIGIDSAPAFVDVPSLLVVIIGTFCVTTACFSIPEVLKSQKLALKTVFYSAEDVTASAKAALEVADIARKKGMLELENHQNLFSHNPIFKKGIGLTTDGTLPEKVEKILQQEIASLSERHTKSASILRKSGELAPAMGLIGTLIGLVQMLQNLDDPSKIGPAMAVALLTTFYGAILSYMVFNPLASKLERNTKQELLTAKIYLRAISSIANKENPRQLETLINALLPPAKRVEFFT